MFGAPYQTHSGELYRKSKRAKGQLEEVFQTPEGRFDRSRILMGLAATKPST
jgi:hypothetical protein